MMADKLAGGLKNLSKMAHIYWVANHLLYAWRYKIYTQIESDLHSCWSNSNNTQTKRSEQYIACPLLNCWRLLNVRASPTLYSILSRGWPYASARERLSVHKEVLFDPSLKLRPEAFTDSYCAAMGVNVAGW